MSALHPPHPHHSTKQQWWSRPSGSKSSTMPAYRASDSSGSVTPTTPTSGVSQAYDDKSHKGLKQSRKFNTLASVMGFKSKKNHPTINIPSGPVSPPLPFQNPPPASAPNSRQPPPRPPRSARPVTASSSSSYQYDPKSPGEPSIYTYPSSEEGAYEPMTPSDQLSRHRTSYQPSLFTFAEQQDQSAMDFRLGDVSSSRYSPSDVRRISVLSDPSVIDPHMRKEQALRVSRVSASSYYPAHQSEQKTPSKIPIGFRAHRDSLEGRKSSRDSLFSKEIDLTSDTDISGIQINPPEPRPLEQRHSDIPVPAMPKVSATMLLTANRPALRKSPSDNVGVAKSSRSASGSRTASPVSSTYGQSGSTAHGDGSFGMNRVANLRNSDSATNEHPSRVSTPIRPKAASVSAGSLSGSNAGRRPSPSIVTSFSSATPLSRNASVTSGTGSAAGSMSSAIQRQQSMSRMRPVPPSRNPPPSSHLPPTPQEKPPSPLTFRSPKNLSTSSLINSANSTVDDPSILTFDLPPSSPSSEASSVSLTFASSTQSSMFGDFESTLSSAYHRSRRNFHSTNAGHVYRQESSPRQPSTTGSHTAKSSQSSNHTLMGALSVRGDTPVQRSIRKSMSQSSLSHIVNGRSDRHRLDAENTGTGNLSPEESSASAVHSMKTLRKQRSMHNTRAPGGSLALPPLPQQLRHASSFNTSTVSDASGSGQSSHGKGDSLASPFGTQRRSANSSALASSAASSVVNTPTTPQTHKKRSIFSSHGRDRERDRDRRDPNVVHERERHDSGIGLSSPDAHHNDKKKSHGIGLGLFSGHFSPSSSSSQLQDTHELRRPPSPAAESVRSVPPPSSPPSMSISSCNASDHLDQHILPPKELLSQMEALADMEAPSSPPQFSDHGLNSETDDEYWDGSSFITADKQSTRSRLDSFSGQSIASSADENGRIIRGEPGLSSLPSTTTRHFAIASGSIHGVLQIDRPSSSRLPTRTVSGTSALARVSASPIARPQTADSFMKSFSSNVANNDGYCQPTGLPPPPRRKGAVISSPTANLFDAAEDQPQISPLSPPPPFRSGVGASRIQRLPSSSSAISTSAAAPTAVVVDNQKPGLQRLSSYETISTYNPNRGSIFRKPSFLVIDDELNERRFGGGGQLVMGNEGKVSGSSSGMIMGTTTTTTTAMGLGTALMMATVPEDSFLILEHGKDSIDLGRDSVGIQEGPFSS